MNVNPDNVKELVNALTELDEENQKRLLAYSIYLQFEKTAKKELGKDDFVFPTQEEYDKEVQKITCKNLGKAVKMIDFFNSLDDNGKAILFMCLQDITNQKNLLIDDSTISISINENKKSTKQYLQQNLENMDYLKAKEAYEKINSLFMRKG